ncbi:MAG: biosynthetic arginine decarboxylase [Nannocystaceae bacterium]|nr:biosynthetic arginine decarboxylase [Nannocystaceae bacterium]
MDTPQGTFVMENSLRRYGVERWGEEFVGVTEQGHLTFRAPGLPPVDLHQVATFLEAQGVHPPFVVRFPSMIGARLDRLSRAFSKAIEENELATSYTGVLPVKVNQRRSVVEAVVSGASVPVGLEAGSKPELLLAMSRPPRDGAPLLVNGFKDREFMRMAFHAAEIGHRVIIILESVREVVRYVDTVAAQSWTVVPDVGVRAKLYAKGSGRWQSSGGETSKFGLTTSEILAVVRRLEAHDLVDKLILLHFHIGSQITRIKQIKQAVREGARLYAELQSGYAPNMQFLDMGGGLGVDYDGSRSSYPSSANYSVEEYASQTVFEVAEAVRLTKAKPPHIITESGRAVVATHAVTITDLREVQGDLLPLPEPTDDENRLISTLRETLELVSVKNYEEYFHDAIDLRDEVLSLFSKGYLTIEDRANAEGLFQRVRLKISRIVATLKRPSEEIVEYLGSAHRKYLANFSIFQSLPDTWAIDQVFPAAPLSRHGERPSVTAEIIDITCDSDGCLKSFAHPEENLRFLPLHERTDTKEPYYLGFFMTGAYQDSLANDHNLLTRTHDVVVQASDAAGPQAPGVRRMEFDAGVVLDIKNGFTNEDALSQMDFDVEGLLSDMQQRHRGQQTTLGEAWAIDMLRSYPYLTRE